MNLETVSPRQWAFLATVRPWDLGKVLLVAKGSCYIAWNGGRKGGLPSPVKASVLERIGVCRRCVVAMHRGTKMAGRLSAHIRGVVGEKPFGAVEAGPLGPCGRRPEEAWARHRGARAGVFGEAA
jgi:hypothetical protein